MDGCGYGYGYGYWMDLVDCMDLAGVGLLSGFNKSVNSSDGWRGLFFLSLSMSWTRH